MLAIAFPAFDPVLVEIGPVAIRWYALAYVASLIIGWRYVRYLARTRFEGLTARTIDDLLVWCTLGVVLGGRLGYVLFYQPGHFFANPREILLVWQGGMSFHGGLVGTIIAILGFAWARKVHVLVVSDIVACAVPIGLFFGRIANFINGELFGRISDVPWAMAFPNGGPEPRHPSQLYQAVMEGMLLFALLTVLVHFTRVSTRPGALTGAFLVGYGIARIIGELFREPDAFLGFIVSGITMGQVLSLPMLALGAFLLYRARSTRRLDAKT
jgi:phosphatidylglycerol:prolipoprotein diacylglycerol transferase